MDKAWGGNFREILLDHFEKMKSKARALAEVQRRPSDAKANDKKHFHSHRNVRHWRQA